MERHHIVLVTLPIQGQINPSLELAKRLIDTGTKVTFLTSVYAQRRIAETNSGGPMPNGLTHASFTDGHDDGIKMTDDHDKYMKELRIQGPKALNDIIAESEQQRHPVTCVVYNLLLSWASEVARVHRIPSALLWIQAATVFDIYYHYFNGFEDHIIDNSNGDPSWKIRFPGIPLSLSKRDLPSHILPATSNNTNSALQSYKVQFDTLDSETKPLVLVNTFDSFEADALKAIDKYELIGIGPLIPSAYLDGKDSFRGDLYRASDDCGEWLDSKQDSSVVYVSFGSMASLPKAQMEEIARGLQGSGRPFLWVIRAADENEELGFTEEFDLETGKIVAWCNQLEVLRHPSLGCFVTHCGWNSTLESVVCGVPVVAFPQRTDQGTNAKLIEDVWRCGVRVRANEDGMVERGEISRCIEAVMDGGERSRDSRDNAVKWKAVAREAMGENGSSNKKLKAFLEEIAAVC